MINYIPPNSGGGYEPPVGGIPAEDLEAAVQAILNKAGANPRATSPRDHGFAAWSYDIQYNTNSGSTGIGKPVCSLIWVPETTTFTKLSIVTRSGGTGATSLANCYLALFDKDGNRLGVSTSAHALWGDGVANWKVSTLTEDSAGSLTITGGPDEYVYGAYLIGTQSSTALTVAANAQGSAQVANAGQLNTAGTAFEAGKIPQSFTTPDVGLTAMPSSITMATITPTAKVWFGALDD